jgi:membrane-bound serine protease (ClpP class)
VLLRRLAAVLCLLAGTLSAWAQSAAAAPEGGVLVVPIQGTVDEGMAHLVQRAVAQAKAEHARAIVLDVYTYGGLVVAGTEIRDALLHSDVPVDAFVGRATSAGALVTLAASRVVMAPGASYGDARPIPFDPKIASFLRGEFESTAVARHRNARLAGAMVDATIDVPAYKEPKAPLNLSTDSAQATGFSEGTVPTLDAAFAHFGLASAARTEAAYTFGEQVARFATNPGISGILLTLGFLGLLIELQTLHGVAGAVGVSSLALFFGTHIYAGFSNGLILALALVGVLLILFELHVLPGHGIAMALGVLILVASVLLAFGGLEFIVGGLQALAIAIVLSAVTFALLQRVLPENAFVKRLTFAGTQGPDYVASADHRHLLGASGTALSFLRPAGVAAFDGLRVDVLTEGEFVPAGTPVRVTRVEGARIFVRALPDTGGSAVS